MNVGELIEELRKLPPELPVYGLTSGFAGEAEDAAVVGVSTFRVTEYSPGYGVIALRHRIGEMYANIITEDL